MVHNTLKQAARKFSKTYEVPYLTALKAVDEPLHELRDLTAPYEAWTVCPTSVGFRLIGNKGPHSTHFTESTRDEVIAKLQQAGIPSRLPEDEDMREHYLRQDAKTASDLAVLTDPARHLFEESDDLTLELADRLRLIREASVTNFWEYRALHRAGLLPGRQLEPLTHYFKAVLPMDYGKLLTDGSKLGVYAVHIWSYLDLRASASGCSEFLPVKLSQLDDLLSGSPAGKLEVRSFDSSPEQNEEKHWESTYELVLQSYAGAAERENKLTIFFKKSPEDLHSELESRGLSVLDFYVVKAKSSPIRYKHTRLGFKQMAVCLDDQSFTILWASADSFLEI